jgi:peptidoglycan hydrolase-like protein with peptidoglycan-binding domain
VTQKRRVLAGAAILVAVTAIAGAVAMSGAQRAAPATEAPVNTATVERGTLSSMASENGTLTDRARPDGSPYVVANQARGTYTELPGDGDKVACGDVLYRVDDHPVLLLCGTVPAYRDLHAGDVGNDVRQLNTNLHNLGYDAGTGIDPNDNGFTSSTQQALEKLQHDKGFDVTGALGIDAAVFLPESVRIAKVAVALGGAAQPGAPVAEATSDTPEVQVDLEPSQQGVVKEGDHAEITLPDNTSVTGKVDRLGRVAQVPAGQSGNAGQDANAGPATIPAYISLDDPRRARGFDRAPVHVDITTSGVENALSVPVTALVGKAGGGFAVEVVRGGRRDFVAVRLGLFDAAGGRVQVEGAVHEGDLVVVPSS